jgi:flagellar assembly protein FliH
MNTKSKFLFDQDFGTPSRSSSPAEPVLPVSEHRDQLRQAEEAGYLRGIAEGRRQAEADAAARLAFATERLASLFADAAGQFEAVAARAECHAAELALIMARTLARTLVERQPLAEIEAIARSVFAHLRGAPHAVVRVNETAVDMVKPRLDQIARECGFTGTIVILGEPEIRVGDARVEWADGGAARDQAALEGAIDEAVRRFVSARQEGGRR